MGRVENQATRRHRNDDGRVWINAAGGRAHERTIGTFPPRGEPRKDGSGRHDTMMHVVTPDLVSINPQGGTTANGVVVVGVTHKDGFKGAAAARAEKKNPKHCNNHKRKCRNEGNTDARLDVELIPLALEATGALGNKVNAYETRVLLPSLKTSPSKKLVPMPVKCIQASRPRCD